MKKILITLLILVLAATSCLAAEITAAEKQFCYSIADSAKTIMMQRQYYNAPRMSIQSVVDEMFASSSSDLALMTKIVDAAYDVPLKDLEHSQEIAIKGFQLYIYQMCMTTGDVYE